TQSAAQRVAQVRADQIGHRIEKRFDVIVEGFAGGSIRNRKKEAGQIVDEGIQQLHAKDRHRRHLPEIAIEAKEDSSQLSVEAEKIEAKRREVGLGKRHLNVEGNI